MTKDQRAEALRIVNEQAEDDGLWFEAQTASEAYLQQELRRLHAAVERASAAPQEPVAWMHEHSNGQNMLITEELKRTLPKAAVSGYTIPLYAAPQPQAPSTNSEK